MNLIDELIKVKNEISNSNEIFKIIELNSTKNKIYGYKFDSGADETLVILGCSHGNEPVGSWFCINLLRKILNNSDEIFREIKRNLLIIPVLDYEVLLKNKKWLNFESNYKCYLSNSYLNPVFDQLEFSYSKNRENIGNDLLKKLDKELKNLKNIKILSIHQTPSIYGGYYYTNIENKNIHRKWQKNLIEKKIPLEILPQGVNVKKYGDGVFGKFSSKNLGEFHNKFGVGECSQIYFDQVLKSEYVVVEIPFAYSPYLYNPTQLEIERKLVEEIIEIINISQNIINLFDEAFLYSNLSNLELKNIFIENNGVYWLKSFSDSDKKILEFLKAHEKMMKHDFCYIIRMIFYKAQFIKMNSTCKNQRIKIESEELFIKINKVLNKTLKLIEFKWLSGERGIEILYSCLDKFLY